LAREPPDGLPPGLNPGPPCFYPAGARKCPVSLWSRQGPAHRDSLDPSQAVCGSAPPGNRTAKNRRIAEQSMVNSIRLRPSAAVHGAVNVVLNGDGTASAGQPPDIGARSGSPAGVKLAPFAAQCQLLVDKPAPTRIMAFWNLSKMSGFSILKGFNLLVR
jgi:hypothetical protein